jgi:hypothetical protein
MAVEPRRGCGYRKIGGMYLVSGPGGRPCDRLPFPLHICPTCNQGIHQTRGWTWVDTYTLVGGAHDICGDWAQEFCPMCAPRLMEKCGLLWIGEKFYRTTKSFSQEAADLGISRRISAIPRGFELGKTWVLLAHPKAMWADSVGQQWQPAIFKVWLPQRIEKILPESERGCDHVKELEEKGITCVFVPDNDPDHRGSVYEDDTDDQMELINA